MSRVDRILELPACIASIAKEAEREGYGHVRRLLDEWRDGTNRFDGPGERLIGGWCEGELVGFAGINVDPHENDHLTARLRRLYVRPAYRGCGLGSRLIRDLVAAARGRFRRMRLRSEMAGAFFTGRGFTPVREPFATHQLELPSSRYGFSEASADWSREFESLASELRELLGETVVDVHHVGSTAVPGLAAKPIIDVLPVVDDVEAVDAAVPALESAGFRTWGEYGLPGRRYFTRDCGGERKVNVHVFADGNPEIDRHLAFRDHLTENGAARAEYELLKRCAFAAHPDDIAAYNDVKDGWIKQVEAAAIAGRCGRYAN